MEKQASDHIVVVNSIVPLGLVYDSITQPFNNTCGYNTGQYKQYKKNQ